MKNRVVITGMGVVAPNGVGLTAFYDALLVGKSGIRFNQRLLDLNFRCQIAGKPDYNDSYLDNYFNQVQRKGLKSTGLEYGMIAGLDAWRDAGFSENNEEPYWDTGVIFGTGIIGVDKFRESIYKIDKLEAKRLGSTAVIQSMASSISAFLGGKIGAGNIVTSNSSACSTGTEAIILGYERIKTGKATRMLVGSCSDSGPYIWAGFDAMRILPSKYNAAPELASRPMSSTSSGFVPGSGAGAMVLESLESAVNRGAKIYAEIKGTHLNSGGHRQGGSMTAPNRTSIQRCIKETCHDAGIQPNTIDAINGHLTGTTKDVEEILNWKIALGLSQQDFPYINTLKSMIGHCIAAAGSIESVASVLQIHNNVIFPNRNCEDLLPEIEDAITRSKVPLNFVSQEVNNVIKASFGFGDVNACVLFSKYLN